MTQNTRHIIARVLPFALYMSFIAAGEIPALWGAPPPGPQASLWVYPVKTALVILALFFLRGFYTDLDWRSLGKVRHTLLSIGVGAAVFAVWIQLNASFSVQGELTSYDPTLIEDNAARLFLICVRVLGAAAMVPIMEELFWKSFLVRYLVDKDFMSVAPGTFTLFTFAATSVLFGLEHQLFAAGIVAGAAFNFIYWKTRSLAQCVLCHAVTNLILAVYVLATQTWHYW